MDMPQDLVPTSEAADIIGCHIATVRRLAERGELRIAMKAPGRNGTYFFKARDVERIAAKRAA